MGPRARAPAGCASRRVRVVGFIDALGSGLFLPLAVIYLTQIVGLRASQVGLGLGLAGVAAIAATPLAGTLLDRWPARDVVLGCFGVSAAAFVAYAAVDSFPAFLAVAVAIQAASQMSRPAVASLVIANGPPEGRVMALGRQQSMRNLGYGIGGLLAGVALLSHRRLAFDAVLWADAASYVIAGVLVVTLADGRSEAKNTSVGGYRAVLRDRRYTGLTLLNVAVALHDSMLRVAMPLWIITRTSVPPAITGPLFALNTFLVAFLQVRVTSAVTRRHNISHAYRIAVAAFGIAAGGFALAPSLPTIPAAGLLAVALIALTVAEQANTAGEAFLSIEMAPPNLQGRYISLFKTSMTIQQAVGPAFVTLVLVHLGETGWLVIAATAATAALSSRSLAKGATFPKDEGAEAEPQKPQRAFREEPLVRTGRPSSSS
jgi:MFS family permease